MPRILVVDDDDTVRSVVGDYLRAADLDVAEAADGPSALQRMSREHFDLIILDLMLPGMDGLEVFRRLRRDGCSAGVVMLTAKDSESDRILGLRSGRTTTCPSPSALGSWCCGSVPSCGGWSQVRPRLRHASLSSMATSGWT